MEMDTFLHAFICEKSPMTSDFFGQISILFAYCGRGDGARTHDLSVPNAARYQLRYASFITKVHINTYVDFLMVEATGLEPTTSWSLTKRATKLRYASMYLLFQIA